jgi:GTP-binding protein
VLFVVDAKIGIQSGDEEVAEILRAARKPVFLLANKIDDPSRDDAALEFHRFGLGDPIPLSALHGYGTGDLLDAIVARLPGSGPAQDRRGGDPGGDPRAPERRQVEPAERDPRRGPA